MGSDSVAPYECTESLTTKKEVQFWRKVIKSIIGNDNSEFNAKNAIALLSAIAYGQIFPVPLSATHCLTTSAVILLVRYAIALAAETERAEALAENASIMIQALLKNTLSDVDFSMKIADCLRSKVERIDYVFTLNKMLLGCPIASSFG